MPVSDDRPRVPPCHCPACKAGKPCRFAIEMNRRRAEAAAGEAAFAAMSRQALVAEARRRDEARLARFVAEERRRQPEVAAAELILWATYDGVLAPPNLDLADFRKALVYLRDNLVPAEG